MQDLQHFIVILVEGVFVARGFHPSEDERAATAYDVHQATGFFEVFDGTTVHASMDGYEVHTVFSVGAHNVQEVLSRNTIRGFSK